MFPTSLGATDLLPFLNDLAAGFAGDTLADVITPTLSLFFQEWFKISPTPDLLGDDWRRYMGAVATLVQVKAIAALVGFSLHSQRYVTKDAVVPNPQHMGGAERRCFQVRMAILVRASYKVECISSRIRKPQFGQRNLLISSA